MAFSKENKALTTNLYQFQKGSQRIASGWRNFRR